MLCIISLYNMPLQNQFLLKPMRRCWQARNFAPEPPFKLARIRHPAPPLCHYFDNRTDSPTRSVFRLHPLSTGRQLKIICISLCATVNILGEFAANVYNMLVGTRARCVRFRQLAGRTTCCFDAVWKDFHGKKCTQNILTVSSIQTYI